MDTTGYIITISLLAIVVRQLREHTLDRTVLLLPFGLVAFTAHTYLSDVPSAGHDVGFDILLGGTGAALGLAGAFATHLRLDGDGDGAVLARAGLLAAGAWILGIGTRLAVALYSDLGGADALGRFSVQHAITGANAWTAALVIMALAQVTVRLAVLQLRKVRLERGAVLGPV